MSTWQLLLTNSTAGWLNLLTFDRRINLYCSAWTVEWLSWDIPAWFAKAQMTERIAGMLSTAQHFIASKKAKMTTTRISHPFLNRTALLLALVFLTWFKNITDLLALKYISFINFFFSHHALSKVIRIINPITFYFSLIFSTNTLLLDDCFTPLAVPNMTWLLALMSPTG